MLFEIQICHLLNNYQDYLDLAAEDVANMEVEHDFKNPIFGVASIEV
jgi:hypothetical protein